MSRVTPSVTKLTHAVRSLSSTPKVARSSHLASTRTSRYLPRNVNDLKQECMKRQLNATGTKPELVDRLAAHDMVSTHRDYHSISAGHRPTMPSPPVYHTIPLMQGFQTSAPKQSMNDMSTIDFFFFPEIPAAPATNPYAKLRVPLLPDNYTPDRSPGSAHAVETMDTAVAPHEINIIASHPEDVLPASISEVVGNDGIDTTLENLTKHFAGSSIQEIKDKSVVGELWNSMMEDVLGSKRNRAV